MLIQVSHEQYEHLILYIISCLTGSGMWIVRSMCFPKLHILDVLTICYPVDHIHEIRRISLLTNEILIDMSEFNGITQKTPHMTV